MIEDIRQFEGLNVTFQVTEDCNLRCRYCYELNKRPGKLPLEYAYQFIEHLLTDPDPIGVKGTKHEWILKRGIVLDFIGGDALMVPELCDAIIMRFVQRAYELNHRWKNTWRVSISTNGTLFSKPGVQRFLEKYRGNISLGVSVDGCPEIHNLNRSNSFDAIWKDWEYYLDYVGDLASTKATLNRDSIPYIAESIKFLHEEMKLHYIHMNFIFEPMGLTSDDLTEIEYQFQKSIDYIFEHRDDIHVNMFSRNVGVGEPMREDQKESGWCGAGSMPTLSINGKIYPCFRFVPVSLSDERFDASCGDIWSGFSRKERFAWLRSHTRDSISPEMCRSCSVESTCAYCVGSAFSESGRIYRQTNLCEVKKLIDKYSRMYWERYDSSRETSNRYNEKGDHTV